VAPMLKPNPRGRVASPRHRVRRSHFRSPSPSTAPPPAAGRRPRYACPRGRGTIGAGDGVLAAASHRTGAGVVRARGVGTVPYGGNRPADALGADATARSKTVDEDTKAGVDTRHGDDGSGEEEVESAVFVADDGACCVGRHRRRRAGEVGRGGGAVVSATPSAVKWSGPLHLWPSRSIRSRPPQAASQSAWVPERRRPRGASNRWRCGRPGPRGRRRRGELPPSRGSPEPWGSSRRPSPLLQGATGAFPRPAPPATAAGDAPRPTSPQSAAAPRWTPP